MDDEECYECAGTGHTEFCESREPAWDLGDILFRAPCNGCCPNGCKLTGMKKLESETAHQLRWLLDDD